MNIEKWIKLNSTSLKGKTIAITGSYGGIATHSVEHFAKLGANFIFLNRNKEKTNNQILTLKEINPEIQAEFIKCDLSNFKEVKDVVKALKTKQIDILFLAAGVYNVELFKTDSGYNNVFQTNFLSHYYIVKELLSNIKSVNGKVIAVGSIAHNYSKIDEIDIDFSNRTKHSKVYGNSKRFLMFALQELAIKENFNLSIIHPGITLTEMTNHYPKAINWLVKIAIKLIFPNPEKACLNFVKGAFENTGYHEWIGPKIFNIYGLPKKKNLKTCTEAESKKIFELSERIYSQISKET